MKVRRIGRYELIELIGTGAFAAVWKAYDPELEAEVAVKVLADNWSMDLGVRERFTEEARLLWRCGGEGAVRVLLVDETETGQPYFVMEYADGGTLEDRMRPEHPLPPEHAIAYVRLIADALERIHALGIVHRDVKPPNIFFKRTASGDGEQLVLGDMGLAKDTLAASGFTMAAGTPQYSAPEQLETNHGLDRRADVHALAVIAHELLTGALPNKHLAPDMPRRASLSPAVAAVLERGRAPHAAQRFANAADFAGALAHAFAAAPPVAAPQQRPSTAQRPSAPARTTSGPSGDRRPRRKATIALVGAAALVGIGGIVVSGDRFGGDEDPVIDLQLISDTTPATTPETSPTVADQGDVEPIGGEAPVSTSEAGGDGFLTAPTTTEVPPAIDVGVIPPSTSGP